MSEFYINLAEIDIEEATDLPRVTYFVLESHDNCILVPLDRAPEYSIHIGLPDRPDRRHTWKFGDLDCALARMQVLHAAYPKAALWLSSEEILAMMRGDSIGVGLINAMAECDPSNNDCEWVQFSGILATATSKGASPTRAINKWLSANVACDALQSALAHL